MKSAVSGSQSVGLPPVCRCGLLAIGQCRDCGAWTCADHGQALEQRWRCERDARKRATSNWFVAAGWPPSAVEDWRSAGWTSAELKLWARRGISSDDACDWVRLDATPAIADRLSKSGWRPRDLERVARDGWSCDDAARWATAGFLASEASAWERAGADVLTARVLRDSGWSAGDAADARSHGLTQHDCIEAVRAGMPPDEAVRWLSVRQPLGPLKRSDVTAKLCHEWASALLEPEQVVQCANLGVDLDTCCAWLLEGLSPDEVKAWMEAGWPLGEAVEWRGIDISPQSAGEWRALGWAPSDAEPWVDKGFPPMEAEAWAGGDIGPGDAWAWRSISVPVEAAALLEADGMVGEQALMWLAKGLSIEQLSLVADGCEECGYRVDPTTVVRVGGRPVHADCVAKCARCGRRAVRSELEETLSRKQWIEVCPSCMGS